MSWALAAFGWAGLALAWLELRRRVELVADAEHELRGPATALALACERMRRPELGAPQATHAEIVEVQLARLRMGLEDLAAARRGRRGAARPESNELGSLALGACAGACGEVQAEWEAGLPRVVAGRGRIASALGNLIANAAEHGDGRVELRGRRAGDAVRVEIRNRLPPAGGGPRGRRGRGLRIASRAARSAGGELELAMADGEVVATLDLPAEDAGAEAA